MGKGSKERIVLYGSKCEEILNIYLESSRGILLGKHVSDYLIVSTNRGNKISTRSIEIVIDNIINKAA